MGIVKTKATWACKPLMFFCYLIWKPKFKKNGKVKFSIPLIFYKRTWVSGISKILYSLIDAILFNSKRTWVSGINKILYSIIF